MDKDGKIVDLLNGKLDLKKKLIKTISDSDKAFHDDSLRILRAIRFKTILDFNLSDEICESIIRNKDLLKNLSYERKKQELDRIFSSKRAKEGISLIKKFHLEDILEIPNLDRIKDYSDINGIWAMINPSNYPFTNSEKELIKNINIVYELDNLNNEILYKYGLYVNVIAGVNKGISKRDILGKYDKLPIKERGDILITANQICELLNKEPGGFIGEIYCDLEKKILNSELVNDFEILKAYINNNYL